MRTNSRRISPDRSGPIAIAGVVVCLLGIWVSTREGLAQRYAGRALLTDSSADADRAVAMNGSVPETHYTRGVVRERAGSANVVTEFESAVALRPNDYALWLELGRVREQAGHTTEAIAAFTESTKLAPFYAPPRWQLGNALFRSGRIPEALAELRRAAHSDAKLTLPTLSLMWSALNGNVIEVERACAPQTPSMETALARFLVKRGKVEDAMRHFRAAGGIAPEEQRSMIADLLAARNFEAAHEIWAANRVQKSAPGEINNPGFEDLITLAEVGFGWQIVHDQQGIQVALDPGERRSGNQSLRVDWSGNGDTWLTIASQLVPVKPNARYEVKFAARGADLVMVGLPTVCVTDAKNLSGEYVLDRAVFVCAPTLPEQTSDWQEYSVEFSAGSSTRAVILRIQREDCSIQPCPAFGHAWFDEFVLTKLED